MSRHESVDQRRARLPLATKLKLLGGVAAGALAVLAPGCGHSNGLTDPTPPEPAPTNSKPINEDQKWDKHTESELRSVIQKPMNAAADEIRLFAKQNPRLTDITTSGVGKKAVTLFVEASTDLRHISGSTKGSLEEDSTSLSVTSQKGQPNNILDVAIYDSVFVTDHPRLDYNAIIEVATPTGSGLPYSGSAHTDGWFARQYGNGRTGPRFQYDTSQPGLHGGPHNPVTGAQMIVQRIPSILQHAESDLDFMASTILVSNGN